ncbi:ATP-binding protein [Aquabacterium sp. A7-Y]|uniref:hybrid sensor histidine kinase/response regulator n=1 Tax=Aquabacterium sp. A7-Y TaxID=1349605 RepID=UPI00223DF111|nr:ATP-binding protein [Aquabacterium sp. A7-Y]MCW7537376.1 ATP-binding protein [Aquabacterium sp. A7-Y]
MNDTPDAAPAQGPADHHLRVLERVATLLSSEQAPEDLPGQALSACLPELGDFGVMDLADGELTQRFVRAHEDPGVEALLQQRPPVSAKHAAPTLEPDDIAEREPATHTVDLELPLPPAPLPSDWPPALAFGSMVSVPIRHHGGLLGALALFMGRSGRQHSPQDRDFAESLATLVAPALINIRLRKTQASTQAALQRSEERLRLAVEAGRLGLWDWDVVQGRIHWSELVYTLYGLPPEGWTGPSVDFLTRLHPEDREPMKLKVHEALRTGALPAAEFRILHPDGQPRWVAIYATIHQDAEGRPLRMVGVSYDVTERLQLLDATRHARADAEAARRDADAANRAKDEFLAMLGHELRNPLAPIVTALHLMDRRGDPASQPERELISRQVAHLSRLVDDLLDISRITRGAIELKLEVLDIAFIVRRAVEQVWPALEKRGLRFDASLPCEALPVSGDATRLVQVFVNLLGNAAKFTPAGGHVALEVEADDGSVRVAVKDTGAGIAPELLPRVFDLFVQRPQPSDRMEGGLGLGLTIARRLVEMHGGRLTAASEGPGLGSVFTVELPRAAIAPAPATPPIPAAPRPAAGRLLVVDDNPDSAEMQAQLLALGGHEVRVAFDGPSALAMVADYTPDVAVLDIGLPGMDGYELAQRLKALPQLSRLRLVALTGYGREPDRERALRSGFDLHLVKPVDPERLLKSIQELVEAR